MAKAEINNEVVLLRHAVRQARVCIVNKLVKEAKNLRNKNGTEAQLEKNKKKADKLIAEVYALKTIKDDEISKFGILNERSLSEILQDQSSSHSLRITARVVYYKNLHRRIMQFRDRFPDYKKHLTEEKKKSAKLKNKNAGKTKKSSKENASRTRSKSSKKQKVESDENMDSQHNSEEDEESCDTKSLEADSNSRKHKKSSNNDSTSLKKQKLTELEEDGTLENTAADKQSNLIKSCNVTKEAAVKRFTELLKEEESNVDVQTTAEGPDSAGTATDGAKVVDDFFLTEDNEDYQGSASSISASTSYAKPYKHNTRAKSLQFSDRGKKQNTKCKNNADLKKYPAERSPAARSEKRTTNKTAKRTNKNNPNEVGNKKENADLHPSWLAKRKEQEVIKQGFQGKKIVFTDD